MDARKHLVSAWRSDHTEPGADQPAARSPGGYSAPHCVVRMRFPASRMALINRATGGEAYQALRANKAASWTETQAGQLCVAAGDIRHT